MSNCDLSPSNQVWLDAGYNTIVPKQEALYDLVFDPNEKESLLHEPAYADVLAQMKAHLRTWMQSSNDPLLTEEAMPLPDDAALNPRDGIHPGTIPRLAKGQR